VLVVLSLFAELLSNDKPLIVRYEGQTYLPLLHDYPETTFGGDFHTPTDYLDPFIRQRLGEGDNWAIFPSTAMASPPSTTLPSRPTLLRRRPTTGWAPTTGGAICWRSSSTVFASACCSAWR
jgi:ABC-type microcin C transport system permease subunit YejE